MTALCRCEVTAQKLRDLGFAVEERTHSMGTSFITIPGASLRDATTAAVRAGAVTLLCFCGETRRRHLERLAGAAEREARAATFRAAWLPHLEGRRCSIATGRDADTLLAEVTAAAALRPLPLPTILTRKETP